MPSFVLLLGLGLAACDAPARPCELAPSWPGGALRAARVHTISEHPPPPAVDLGWESRLITHSDVLPAM